MLMDLDKMNEVMEKTIARKHIYGAVFHVSTEGGRQSWSQAGGNMEINSRYYIASINKLIIAAVVLKLIAAGRLSLDDPLAEHVPQHVIRGLHVFRGRDYSRDITILHMLSQTSGLPCYITDRPARGTSVMKELEAGRDQPWPIDKVIARIKEMKPHFPPGEGNKARYIDTNHQLLNLVIEKVTQTPVKTVLNQLFSVLGMTDTYVCETLDDSGFVFPFYQDRPMDVRRFLISTHNDVISTVSDQMRFIKAFFRGEFYPRDRLQALEKWKRIFFPFQYGIGLQKFSMPRYLSPCQAVPDMIGHCGSTGAVAFYIPDMKLYITGTTNQQANPSAAFQTMIRLVHTLRV